MDLNRVSVFVHVVEAGSFAAAARHLGLPRPTVSRKVAALENELGVRLLNRTTRSLALTDAGQRYFERCRLALQAMDIASAEAAGEQDVPSGCIRVSAPAEDHFLSEAVGRFLCRYPEVRAEVVLTDKRLDLIEERIDVALRAGSLPDSSLIARKLMPTRRIVCASPDYLRDHGSPETPADLRKHVCVAPGGSASRVSWTLRNGRRRETVSVEARLAANSMRFVMRSAMAGVGIALLPDALARASLENGSLVHILEAWSADEGGLHLVMPGGRHQTAVIRAFADFMVDYVEAIAASGEFGFQADRAVSEQPD